MVNQIIIKAGMHNEYRTISEIKKSSKEGEIMKPGTKVKTEAHGTGIVISKEYHTGVLSERYLVKLDNCPNRFMDMHIRQGGLYYWECQLLTM